MGARRPAGTMVRGEVAVGPGAPMDCPASLAAHASSLLELPIAEPHDPQEGSEAPLGVASDVLVGRRARECKQTRIERPGQP